MIKYFNFKGRISGKQFGIRCCAISFIGIGIAFLLGMYFLRIPGLSEEVLGVLAILIVLLMMVAHTSNVVKRCHDLDLSTFVGIIIVLIVVILSVFASTIDKNLGKVLGVIPAIALAVKEGTKGPNKYGPDPLQEDKSKEVSASNPTNPPAVDTRDSNTAPVDSQSQSGVQELIQASDKVYQDNVTSLNIKTEESSAGGENSLNSASNNYKQSRLTLSDLRKLKQLLDSGIITQEDFDAAKKKILS